MAAVSDGAVQELPFGRFGITGWLLRLEGEDVLWSRELYGFLEDFTVFFRIDRGWF